MKRHRTQTTAGTTHGKTEHGKGRFDCSPCGPEMMELMRSMASKGKGPQSDRMGCCTDDHSMSDCFSSFFQRKRPVKEQNRAKK